MTYTRCMLDKEGYPRARAHTHRRICNTYCFSTAEVIRESTSMLRYTYIACLVTYHIHFLVSVG